MSPLVALNRKSIASSPESPILMSPLVVLISVSHATSYSKSTDPDTDFAQRVFRGQSYVVQEMDAASHRGIDDIRQLRERVGLPPQEGKMAVYILDEVHMLTKEAFNVFIKKF